MPPHEHLRDTTDSHSFLVSADRLESLLGDPAVKIFDVRGTWQTTPASALQEDYEKGHVPGAVFLDWTSHFIEQGVPLGLASVADESGAAKAFRTLGINEDDLVILYDDYHHMQAGRIWWAMRRWGFDNVSVLNGGWRYWSAQNKPISMASPTITPGTFQPKAHDELVVDLNEFLVAKDGHCVIDGRGAENFAGKADDPRTGHIPGSLNIQFRDVLDAETGLFLDPDALSRVFDDMTPEWRQKPVIATCGSGYAATVILLALSELRQGGRLFDGSFAVWKQDPDRPVSQSPNT